MPSNPKFQVQLKTLDLRIPSQKELFKQWLRDYVPREVLAGNEKVEEKPLDKAKGALMRSSLRSPRKTSVVPVEGDEEEGKPQNETKTKGDDDIGAVAGDDFISQMTIETYIEFRAKQLVRLVQDASTPIAKRLSNLEMLVILVGAVGTLLAAFDKSRWVAITVACGTLVTNVMQHEMLQQRLHAINSASRQLMGNQVHMDSLSIVSKRTQKMKGDCVGTVEAAILETVSAWTGMSAKPSAQAGASKKEK